MNHKWHVGRKGYLKIHMAVDIKKKRILSLEGTSEEVHDGNMLKKLVDNASEKNSLKSVFADGTYDSNNNFRYLLKKHIKPGIKTTSNFMSHDFLLLELGRRIPSWIWSSQAQSGLPIQIWTPSLSDKEHYSVRCLLNRDETTNRMVK